MAAHLIINDGNPYWLSPSIVPSRDTVVPVSGSPSQAAISQNDTDVFVYVKCENPAGADDLGSCACTNTGQWKEAVAFQFADFSNNVTTYPRPGGQESVKVDSANGDKLIIPGMASSLLSGAPVPQPARRAWGWSPDGRFLAYTVTGGAPGSGIGISDWKLSIWALQPFTRSDGTTVAKGARIMSAQSGAVWPWTQNFFRWAGSDAIVVGGPLDPVNFQQGGLTNPPMEWFVLCPARPQTTPVLHMNAPGPTFTGTPPGTLDGWIYTVSPCGKALCFLANVAAQAQAPVILISTEQGVLSTFRSNNGVLTGLTTIPAHPTISTAFHTALGVTIDRGDNRSFYTVDDPDCAAIYQDVQVAVDRVKASTLPNAQWSGVLAVGVASGGPLPAGTSKWVQVPNGNDWHNLGEDHWCLLAQAFTVDGTTIPRPWNGQAPSPPPFPVGDENCAQHNIMIS